MKFLRISKAFLLIVVIATGIFVACNKEKTTVAATTENLALSKVPNIEVKEGYLVFKDQEQFNRLIESLSELSPADLDNWEKNIGFNSLRHIYSEASKELTQICEARDEKAAQNFEKKWQGKVIFNKNDYTIAPLIDASFLNRILGEKKVLKVGKYLRVYFNNKVVFILDGDISKLQEATNTEVGKKEHNKIIAIPFKFDVIANYEKDGFRTETMNCENTFASPTVGGTFKIKGLVKIFEGMEIISQNANGSYNCESWARTQFTIESLKKSAFWWYINNPATLNLDMDIRGVGTGGCSVWWNLFITSPPNTSFWEKYNAYGGPSTSVPAQVPCNTFTSFNPGSNTGDPSYSFRVGSFAKFKATTFNKEVVVATVSCQVIK